MAAREVQMRSDTKTMSIEAGAEKVRAFLANPENLPRWAVGFAKAVRREGDRWIVTTGGGELPLRVESDPRWGTVDFHMTLGDDREALAASRVLPRGAGAEVVFTQFQAPGMPDEVFAQNVSTIAHELEVLKSVCEVRTP